MEELIRCYVCDKQIGPAIIIKVADRYTHSVSGACDSRFLRDIGESPVPIVVEQAVPIHGRILGERRDGSTVHQVDIEIAVAVVVKKCHAGHHRLDLILVCGRGVCGDKL